MFVELKEKQLLHQFKGHEASVNALVFNPKWKYIASGSDDRTIRIWKLNNNNECIVLSGHDYAIRALNSNHTGSILASGASDGTICIWDVAKEKCIRTLTGHTGCITALLFMPHKPYRLISGSHDGTIRIWGATGECLDTINCESGVVSFIYDAYNDSLISVSINNELRVWCQEGHNWICLKKMTGIRGWATSLACDPFGRFLLALSQEERVHMLRMYIDKEWTNECIVRPEVNYLVCYNTHFSGQPKLASGEFDESRRITHFQTGSNVELLQGHEEGVNPLVCFNNGNYIAYATWDKKIKIINILSEDLNNCLAKLSVQQARALVLMYAKTRSQQVLSNYLGEFLQNHYRQLPPLLQKIFQRVVFKKFPALSKLGNLCAPQKP